MFFVNNPVSGAVDFWAAAAIGDKEWGNFPSVRSYVCPSVPF